MDATAIAADVCEYVVLNVLRWYKEVMQIYCLGGLGVECFSL